VRGGQRPSWRRVCGRSPIGARPCGVRQRSAATRAAAKSRCLVAQPGTPTAPRAGPVGIPQSSITRRPDRTSPAFSASSGSRRNREASGPPRRPTTARQVDTTSSQRRSVARGGVEPPTFRFSGPRCSVRLRSAPSVTCAETFSRPLAHTRERTRMRRKKRRIQGTDRTIRHRTLGNRHSIP
jgi:hypothetical protein